MNGTDDVSKSLNIKVVVLNTVGEQKRDLFRLNALTGDEVSLHSLNRGGEALFENVLVVHDDLETDDGGSVWSQSLHFSEFKELPQEVVSWLFDFADAIFDLDDGVVGVSLSQGWHES